MEKDIKHAIKNLEEKRKKVEKTEKIILFLSGIILIVIFAIIGLNIYSGMGQKVSEPEVEIVSGKKLQVQKEVILPKDETPTEKSTVEKKEDTKLKIEPKVEKKEKNILPEKETTKMETVSQVPLSDFYTIQLGAFKSKSNAEKFIKSKKLENAFIYHDGPFFRVMIGKFKTKKEAYSFLKEKGLKGLVKKIKAPTN